MVEPGPTPRSFASCKESELVEGDPGMSTSRGAVGPCFLSLVTAVRESCVVVLSRSHCPMVGSLSSGDRHHVTLPSGPALPPPEAQGVQRLNSYSARGTPVMDGLYSALTTMPTFNPAQLTLSSLLLCSCTIFLLPQRLFFPCGLNKSFERQHVQGSIYVYPTVYGLVLHCGNTCTSLYAKPVSL